MHPENMAILKSLVVVAWADGSVAEEEKEVIEALLQSFDATAVDAEIVRQYAAEPKTLDDIPITDLSAEDRRVLVQHAVLLTFVDGEQHETEKKFIDDLCGKLRIPADESKTLIEAAESRAKRFLNLL